MKTDLSVRAVAFASILLGQGCVAFVQRRSSCRQMGSLAAFSEDRRAFLGHSVASATSLATLTVMMPPALAADSEDSSDMSSQLFNPDGSLKEKMETEVKFRTVELVWDASEQGAIAVDGDNTAGTQKGSSVRLTYQLPEKWSSGSNLYLDAEKGAKACDRITVYQAAGTATMKRLEKASTTGIGKALNVADDLKEIRSADLVGGRTAVRNELKFYEFDMAVAPATCEASKEDLGLGFCPYESVYLLSSTVLDDRLYVFALTCNKEEWIRSSSDLRRARSSFIIEQV
jgi:hypothetical protein